MLRGVFSQNTPLIPPKSISLREIAGGAGSKAAFPPAPPIYTNTNRRLVIGVNVWGAF